MSRALLRLFMLGSMLLTSCRDAPIAKPPAPVKATHQIPSAPPHVLGGEVTMKDPRSQEPLRVGGDVKAPVLLSRPQMDVSRCGKVRARGIAFLETVIEADGTVRNVRTIKPLEPCLDKMWVATVKQWRFKPGTLNGKPVPVLYHLTVSPHYR